MELSNLIFNEQAKKSKEFYWKNKENNSKNKSSGKNNLIKAEKIVNLPKLGDLKWFINSENKTIIQGKIKSIGFGTGENENKIFANLEIYINTDINSDYTYKLIENLKVSHLFDNEKLAIDYLIKNLQILKYKPKNI